MPSHYSEQELRQATEAVFRDPEVARTLEAWKAMHDRTGSWQAGRTISPEETAFRQAVAATGQLPEGSHITWQNGSPVVANRGLPGWAYPLIIGGIAVTAGLATGAIATGGAVAAGAGGTGGAAGSAAGGGGAAGAAGGGAGAASALEGGATAGLGGSGFGTGAGLGFEGVGAAGAGGAGAAPILGSTTTVPGAGTLPAGGSTILGSTAGGSNLTSSLLNRENILGAAGIASSGISAYQQAQRDKETAENQRLRLQLDERALGQQNEQFGASFGQRNEQFGVDTGFRNKELELKAPGQRLTTGVRGSMVANQSPVTAHWGGPGSGLSGGIVKFTGGAANPNLINADARALGEDVTHQALLQQLAHDDKVPYNPTPYTPTQRDPILDVQQPSTTAEAVDAYGRRRTPTSILDPDADRAILRTR